MSVSLLLPVLLFAAGPPEVPPAANAASDEDGLRALGLPTDGPALVDFLRQRSRLDVDVAALTGLTDDLASNDARVQTRATARLVMHGPAALPALRRAINDLGEPKRAARARKAFELIAGPEADAVAARVVRLIAKRQPVGATEALLAFLPAADSDAVIDEVGKALAVLAFLDKKPQAALLAALKDALPLRRAVACSALAQHDYPEQLDVLRPLLKDPKPTVRLRAALALLNAGDPDAVPALIDLLGELPAPAWGQAEEALKALAGPWAPAVELKGEDEIARRIRREVWAVWWKHTDGPALLTEFRKRTLSPADRDVAVAKIEKLDDDDFDVRQKAIDDLAAMSTRVLPLLRDAAKGKNLERANRANECIARIVEEAKPLPAAAIRLLCLRKPEGTLQALLDYLPFAEDEALAEEVRVGLPSVGGLRREPDPILLRALDDKDQTRRLAAAEAVLQIAGDRMLPAVRRLLQDRDPVVRLRVALILGRARDKTAVPTLIEALAGEPSELQGQAMAFLERLAGDKAPETEPAEDAAGRLKVRDAWAAWWKTAEPTVEIGAPSPLLGLTLLVESPKQGNGGRVQEVGPDGKQRWEINNLDGPMDAHVVGGNRVLIAEYGGNRVSERDFKNNVIWKRDIDSPTNVQRLPNGNTFVAATDGFYELDRTGKEVWSLKFKDVDGGVKGPDNVITCLTRDNRVVRLGMNGQELKSARCKRNDDEVGGIDLLPNGRVLVAQPSDNSVAEFDPQGNMTATFAVAGGVSSATGLPGGTVLVAGHDAMRYAEVDRTGKVIQTFKSEWGVWRARRR